MLQAVEFRGQVDRLTGGGQKLRDFLSWNYVMLVRDDGQLEGKKKSACQMSVTLSRKKLNSTTSNFNNQKVLFRLSFKLVSITICRL